MQHELLVRQIAESKVDFLGSEAKKIDMVDHEDNHHVVYAFGEIKEECAVKFHNIMPDIELFSNDKKLQNLLNAIEHLKANGGVLVFLDNENSRQKEMKEYGVGAQILKKLGIKKIHLLTSSKGKEYVGLGGFGLEIVEEL
jgi:3,4-dihydroxy 2-butanone 4-phosphate synthase/GTP cyclohydrolase II